jgi:vacuolar-type H+-ATPase subunit F/Vma7
MAGVGSEAGDGAAWVLGDAATVRGFRLAGYAGCIVESAEEARAALAALRAQGVALVVMTERLCHALGGPETLVAGPLRPVVAVVPEASGLRVGPTPADVLARGVRRALGIPAKPQEAGA